MATNSAPAGCTARPTPASTSTSYSAACTTLLVVTTRIAPTTMIDGDDAEGDVLRDHGRRRSCRQPHRRHLLDLLLGAGLVGLELGHGLHPLAEAGPCRGAGRRSWARSTRTRGSRTGRRTGTPRRRCRSTCTASSRCRSGRARSTVRGLPPGAAGRRQLLVALDVDAPVGALAGAQHADRAVLLEQGDDAAGPRRRRFLLVRVLHGGRALAGRMLLRACRKIVLTISSNVTPRPLTSPCPGSSGIRTPPSGSAVTRMLTSAIGMRHFQAKPLELVLTEARVGEADPEDDDRRRS